MTDFLGNPKVQYFESGTSEALAGGKLYSYAAGTTTKVHTYPTALDFTKSINPNTNPIILDARGEASVVVSNNTKLVLKDKNDNTIWTVDAVSPTIFPSNKVDDEGDIILAYVTVSNSENYWKMSSAITGDAPIIGTDGVDVNVNGILRAKGSGKVLFEGGVTGEVTLGATSIGDINCKRNTVITGTLGASGLSCTTDLTVDVNTTHTGTTTTTGTTTSSGAIDVLSDKVVKMNGNTALVPATATQQGEVRVNEDSDNGTNYTGLNSPVVVTSSVTLSLPDGAGTAGQSLITDGSASLGYTGPGRWDLLSTIVPAADTGADTFTSLITSTYTNYKLVFSKVTPAGGVGYTPGSVNTSSNNGTSYSFLSTATNTEFNGSSTTHNQTSSGTMWATNGDEEAVSGELLILDPQGASGPIFTGQFSYVRSGVLINHLYTSFPAAAAPVNALRLYSWSGGTVSLYGQVI